jgi:hypothetical protein
MPKKSPSASVETAATPKPRKGSAAKVAPTHDEIALRAYHIYLQRNGATGSPFDDWKRAEQELLSESAKPKSRRRSKVVPFAA